MSNPLGDTILATGAVPILAARYPGEPIVAASGPAAVPLLAAMPKVAAAWSMTRLPWGGHWRALWIKARRTKWTAVVDLRGSAFAYTVRARDRFVLGRDDKTQHRVDRLSAFLGTAVPAAPQLTWTQDQIAAARQRIGEDERSILALGPGAKWIGKTWPPDRYAALAQALTAAEGPLAGARVLIAGAPDERMAATLLLDAIPDEQRIEAFGWPLPELAAALSTVALYVGNDTGLMHLAAATGAPTLGLFGPSRDRLYRPWGRFTRTVRTATSFEEFARLPTFGKPESGSLLREITVDRVSEEAGALLAEAADTAVPSSQRPCPDGCN